MKLGVIGSGAMGSGIGQVAAMAGWEVYLYDSNPEARSRALSQISESINKLVSKQKLTPELGVAAFGRIYACEQMQTMADADMVIEAIVEQVAAKKSVFEALEQVVSPTCIIATNTSSLSVTALASALQHPERFIGIHFFNPPVLMKLVEVIPAIQTDATLPMRIQKIIESWGKTALIAKDTPGFIVNKVARPFYSEAIRIYEEGLASPQEIDFIMMQHGFKMGPFALMDFIGHDVNYFVTESVWKAFYYDSKYKPSLAQLKLVEAGYLGRKKGRGFYDYSQELVSVSAVEDSLSKSVFMRIISMLVNEAVDTVYLGICTEEAVDLAVKLGVNYPKGLLEWGHELGMQQVVNTLDELYHFYHEERYRVCAGLRNLAKL
ncbi:MAG: 3-hydroxybutyryl-CoA dehydrogenase [Chitinophagales bacterium]|nr:3-hydroxybutyryl-CoA dehydrogenase [Chitinophagales bacterium]